MNRDRIHDHRLRNLAHSVLLLGAMGLLVAWIGVRWWKRRDDASFAALRWWEAASLAAAFVLGFSALAGVVAARNHAVSGEFVIATGDSGVMLYIGHNPHSTKGKKAMASKAKTRNW